MNKTEKIAICKKYLHREVMIKSKQGTIRGTIVKVDNNKIYVKTTRKGKKAYVSFLPFILPLVLFDLLAIALIDTRPWCNPLSPQV
ncbi:hypothetical protein [Paenibacillus sp. SI8]|uniref:hypothetical protein n=1 Tax=unclassified Paenibacillus TaxID=185978 RepID=UPI0034674D42